PPGVSRARGEMSIDSSRTTSRARAIERSVARPRAQAPEEEDSMRPAIHRGARAAIGIAGAVLLGCQSPISNPFGNRAGATGPAEWGGVWEVHVQSRACMNDSVLFDATHTDTVCTGAPLAVEFDFPKLLSMGQFDLGLLCSGSTPELHQNQISFSCSGAATVNGCQTTAATNTTLTLVPAEHIYSGTGRVSIDVQPNDAMCGPDHC